MATERMTQAKFDAQVWIDALQPDEPPFITILNDPNFVHRPVPPYKPPSRWSQARGQIKWWTTDARTWVAMKIAPWLDER